MLESDMLHSGIADWQNQVYITDVATSYAYIHNVLQPPGRILGCLFISLQMYMLCEINRFSCHIFFLSPYISGDSRLKFPCATIGRILTLCRITMYPPTINHHCWLYHWFYKTRTPWFWVGFHCLDPMRVFPKSQYIYIYPNLSQLIPTNSALWGWASILFFAHRKLSWRPLPLNVPAGQWWTVGLPTGHPVPL